MSKTPSPYFIDRTEKIKKARNLAKKSFEKIVGYGRFKSYNQTYDNPITDIKDTIVSKKSQLTLEEIVFPQNVNNKEHEWSHSISLCGKGGTGKTHQFLNLIKEILCGINKDGQLKYPNIIPFYLELNDITEITDNVIISELSKSLNITEKELKEILNNINSHTIIFADGLNEVTNREIRVAIAKSICNIRSEYKTRIILSSREDHSDLFNNLGRGLYQKFEKAEICDLTELQINNYFESENIKIRYRDVPFSTRKLLLTAQGLSMYTEMIKADQNSILEFKTLGSLLQTYCDRIMQITRTDALVDLSFEDYLSYIAYQMVLDGKFQLKKDELCLLISRSNHDFFVENEKISLIFANHGKDGYEFSHQNFRDYFAGLFLAKKIDSTDLNNIYLLLDENLSNNNVTNNDEILSLCSDFLKNDDIQRIIDIIKFSRMNNYSFSLSILIRIYAFLNQNNISGLNLDSLDLTNTPLSNYKLYSYDDGEKSVSLKNSKISEDTFLQNGLQTASSTICSYIYNNKEYICAFSASNALIYDIINNTWKCIHNLPNYGWVNCCCVINKKEQPYILLGCKDDVISTFDPSTFRINGNMDSPVNSNGGIESIICVVGIDSKLKIVFSNSHGDVFMINASQLPDSSHIKRINHFSIELIQAAQKIFDSMDIHLVSRMTVSDKYLYLGFGCDILRCRLPLSDNPTFEVFKHFETNKIIKDIMYSNDVLFINHGNEITLVDCNDIDIDVEPFTLEANKKLHHFTKFSDSDEQLTVVVGVAAINNDYSQIDNFYCISANYISRDDKYVINGEKISGLQTLATYTGVYFYSPKSHTQRIATVSDDRSVQIISPNDENMETIIHRGSYDGIHYVDIIEENQILVAQYDGSISYWKKHRKGTWQCLDVFDIHRGWVWKVQHYFQNNDLCFISCSYDGTLKAVNTRTGKEETLINLSLNLSTNPILDFELSFDENNEIEKIWAISEKNILLWNSHDRNNIIKYSMPPEFGFLNYSFRSIALFDNKKPYIAFRTNEKNNKEPCYVAEISDNSLRLSIEIEKECGFIRCIKIFTINSQELMIIGGNKDNLQYFGIYIMSNNNWMYVGSSNQLCTTENELSDFGQINDFAIETVSDEAREKIHFWLHVAYKNSRFTKYEIFIENNQAIIKHIKTIDVGSQPMCVNIGYSNLVIGKLNGELDIHNKILNENYKIRTYANLTTSVAVKLGHADFGGEDNKNNFEKIFKGYFDFIH